MKPTKVSKVEEAIQKIKEAQAQLNLNLNSNKIGDAGVCLLAQSLKEARVPVTLDLCNNDIGEDGAKFLVQTIKEARVPLTLYLSSNNIGEAGAEFLAQGIKEALFPLTLYLSSNNIGEAGAEFLSQGIKEARVPLILYLNSNNIGEAGIKSLSQSIKEARVPLTLGLHNNNIGDAGIGLLAQSIKETRIPLTLDLSFSNNIGDAGAELLAQSLKEARFPLILNLNSNNIGAVGARFIAQGIKEARVPLTLDLNSNNIGGVGVMFLAQGIKEARVPLTLNLCGNAVGDAGAKFIAQSIREAQVPLILYLGGNNIRETGAKFLAQSVKEARFPLTLDLYNNNIGDSGTMFFVQSIKEARVPLALDIRNCGTNDVGLLCNAEMDNFIIDARSNPSEFFAKLKFNPFNLLGLRPILIQTSVVEALVILNYPKDIAVIVQEYAHDDEFLAWKVVAAIRAIEGASHDNKYSSINYELLNAVYSTTSVAENSALKGTARIDDDGQDTRIGLVQALNTEEHDSVAKIKLGLHRASILFKTLDFVVDSARFVQEPTMTQGKKLVLDYSYLYGMVSGVNGYSAMIAGAETLYQLQLGEYQKAFNVASSTMSAMVFPVILAMANRPYLGIAYGVWISTSTAYGAIRNAYSFATEFVSGDVSLRSATAYKNLAEWLAASPVQALYDFRVKAKEYKLQINDILFDKEKSIVQAKVKDEFSQKVFEYIYMPELIEKYVLLNDVVRGKLTEEEAQGSKSKPVAISYGELEYDYCVRTEDSGKETTEYYYCCNIAGQILDHVVLTVSGGLEVLERL